MSLRLSDTAVVGFNFFVNYYNFFVILDEKRLQS